MHIIDINNFPLIIQEYPSRDIFFINPKFYDHTASIKGYTTLYDNLEDAYLVPSAPAYSHNVLYKLQWKNSIAYIRY